ncbi:hypothetical protein CR513_34017, partial [Mucuna pruriens]
MGWLRGPHFDGHGERCSTEVKNFNPTASELSPKSTKCYFIKYPINFKGYILYCLTSGTRIIEAATTKFLENDMNGYDIIVDEKERKVVNCDDFFTILSESKSNIGCMLDPKNYSEVISSIMFEKWINVMNDEISSMHHNEAPDHAKTKWMQVGIQDKEILQGKCRVHRKRGHYGFSISSHYDIELHQMDASRKWYLKFDEIITSMSFVENKVNQCIYLKACENKFIILILYVDDILLARNNVYLLTDTKNMLSMSFDMKDLGETSFVLRIDIYRDRLRKQLGFSQRAYLILIEL